MMKHEEGSSRTQPSIISGPKRCITYCRQSQLAVQGSWVDEPPFNQSRKSSIIGRGQYLDGWLSFFFRKILKIYFCEISWSTIFQYFSKIISLSNLLYWRNCGNEGCKVWQLKWRREVGYPWATPSLFCWKNLRKIVGDLIAIHHSFSILFTWIS